MTKITLVRVDGDAKHEVDIPVGETIIGRGPVMQCTDKRVSRTHAQIRLSEDGKIELTSTSQNPVYYKDGKIISKSTSVELNIGDQFSFLPDSYCYCVKPHHTEGSESSQEMGSARDNFRNNDTSEEPMSTELTSCKDTTIYSLNNTSHSDKIIVPLIDADITTDTSSDAVGVCTSIDSQKNGPTDASLDSVKKYVPRWLLAATERVKASEGESSEVSIDTKKIEEGESVKKEVPLKRKINEDHAEVTPTARAHQLSDESETEEPAKENHSHGQQSVDKDHTNVDIEEKTQSNPDSPHNSHSPSRSTRDSCRYGASCYRKNPQHRAEFSHPGDPDYKEDNRPECPYGTECYRKNPLHKQSYKHTKKPSKTPPKKRQKTNTAEADENSEEDDYDYDDPFLNDGSSDDYEPTDSDSDVSVSDGEEEEDTKRMKKESKRFIRGNKKN